MEDLGKRFADEANQYARLRQSAELNVVRWQWASGPIHELRPYWAERVGLKRGRALDREPAKKDGAYLYGFDSLNRVVIKRQGTELKDVFEDEFFQYKDDAVHTVRFSALPGQPIGSVARYEFHQGMLVKAEGHSEFGRDQEVYSYGDGRLLRIDVLQQEHGGELNSSTYVVDYDEFGILSSIRMVKPEAYARTIYARPEKAASIAAIIQLLENRLVELIPNAVARARISTPAYCLILVYGEETVNCLPPLVGVGLEAERQRWIAEHPDRAKWYVWNPAEFAFFEKTELQLNDPELNSACAFLNSQMASKGSCAEATKLLNKVAAELARIDWRGRLETTPDFIVFASDLEGADLASNMKASVPAGKLKQLKKVGLV